MGKRGTEEWNLETGANPEDQGCRGPLAEQQNVKECLSNTAQRPPHHAVPTAMQNRVTKTMSVAPPLGNNLSKRSPTLQPSTTSLLLISSGLASSWESSSPPSSWSRLDSEDSWLRTRLIVHTNHITGVYGVWGTDIEHRSVKINHQTTHALVGSHAFKRHRVTSGKITFQIHGNLLKSLFDWWSLI